jgi:hypothetical protein
MNGTERDDINPSFLRKDELEYEIFARKGQPPQLRKVVHLQETLREPVQLQYLLSMDFEGELRTIHTKVSEFKEIVGDCRADCYVSPNQYERVTSRLRHLNGRVADLLSSNKVKRDKLSLLEGFQDRIADLMQTVTELNYITNVLPNDPELPSVSFARDPPVTASVNTAPSEVPGFSLGHHFSNHLVRAKLLCILLRARSFSVLDSPIQLKEFCPTNPCYPVTRLTLSSPF